MTDTLQPLSAAGRWASAARRAGRAGLRAAAILEAMRSPRAWTTRRLGAPTPVGLVVVSLLLVASDWASHLAGDSVVPGGPLDECAHLTTMLLVLWALGPAITRRVLVAALIASVAIDVDHVPQHLGTQWLTSGTPRPYPHSLLTVAVVLGLAWLWHSRRVLWLGVALGLVVHFWRDLSESGPGVSLWWPVSYQWVSLPHWSYVVVMGVLVAVVAVRLSAERLAVRHASSEPA